MLLFEYKYKYIEFELNILIITENLLCPTLKHRAMESLKISFLHNATKALSYKHSIILIHTFT